MTTNLIKILIGFVIVSYIIYSRLFMIRVPRDLYNTLTIIQVTFYVVILLYFVILLIYNCYKFINKNKSKESSKYINFMLEILQNPKNPLIFLYDSLVSFDIFIKNNLPQHDIRRNYGHFICEKLNYFLAKKDPLSIYTLLGLVIIPQFCCCFAFAFDILLYQNFYYFYKIIWFLIIPVVIHYIIYSIDFNTEAQLAYLNDFLIFKIIGNNTESIPINIDKWYEIRQLLKTDDEKEDIFCAIYLTEETLESISDPEIRAVILQNCLDNMYLFFDCRAYLTKFKEIRQKWIIPFNIIRYTVYILCWLYVLSFGLNLF